jgi:hypothetical protein
MSDYAVLQAAGSTEVSRRLTARVADQAIALAAVIERHGSKDAGADRTVAFLREWAGTSLPDAVPALTRVWLDHPLDRVVSRFGLSRHEVDLLLLAGLAEEHEGLAGILRALHPYAEPHLSAGLAALVLAEAGVDRVQLRALLTSGSAIRYGLLQVSGRGSLFERSLMLADRLWDEMHGLDVSPAAWPALPVPHVTAGLDGWLEAPSVHHAGRLLRDRATVTLMVSDADEIIALSRCEALARSAGARVLAARLPVGDAAAIALLTAHAAAQGTVPVVVASEATPNAGPPSLAVGDLPGPVVVCTGGRAVIPDPHRPVVLLATTPASVADRRTAWRMALPGLDDAAAAQLAARHPIDPARIAQIGIDGGADVSASGGLVDPAVVAGLIRRRCVVSLPDGINLTTPFVPWSCLVLPENAALQLRDAVSRLHHQAVVLDDWGLRELARASRGARLLFTGPPGTGKSLAAGAVATAAGTDLLRVDVSQLVSKWIGETEKNLAGAFDVAERTQAVLLLDEADALFGSRTQISDAHDRYANQETAYLLQRLDGFEGLVVLTTNLRNNLDAAFLRRLDFVVDFPLPDEAGRRDLWALHLPAERLGACVDLDVLARLYPIPGGWIRNAAVAAAFIAAAAGDRIRQAHLVASVRREYEKAPLPFPGEPPRRRDDM